MTNFYYCNCVYSLMESGEFTVKYFSKAKVKLKLGKLTRLLEELDVGFCCSKATDVVLVQLTH